MSKLRFLHEFIAPFTEAFGFPPEPPPCFYLEGHPLLEEPCQISTPDLGNVCLLNGITFHVDDDLGCQMFIENRTGLIAAVRAAQGSNHAEQRKGEPAGNNEVEALLRRQHEYWSSLTGAAGTLV